MRATELNRRVFPWFSFCSTRDIYRRNEISRRGCLLMRLWFMTGTNSREIASIFRILWILFTNGELSYPFFSFFLFVVTELRIFTHFWRKVWLFVRFSSFLSFFLFEKVVEVSLKLWFLNVINENEISRRNWCLNKYLSIWFSVC